MREVQRRQREFRLPLSEDVELDLHCRDDIQKTLQGIQDLYSDPNFREPVFKLLDETILPDADRHQGRPGMDLWSIVVPGIVKQAKRMCKVPIFLGLHKWQKGDGFLGSEAGRWRSGFNFRYSPSRSSFNSRSCRVRNVSRCSSARFHTSLHTPAVLRNAAS